MILRSGLGTPYGYSHRVHGMQNARLLTGSKHPVCTMERGIAHMGCLEYLPERPCCIPCTLRLRGKGGMSSWGRALRAFWRPLGRIPPYPCQGHPPCAAAGRTRDVLRPAGSSVACPKGPAEAACRRRFRELGAPTANLADVRMIDAWPANEAMLVIAGERSLLETASDMRAGAGHQLR